MAKAKWATGAAMVACTGALVAYGFVGQAGAATVSGAAASAPSGHTASGGTSARAEAPVLSGKRQVSIVRKQAFEGALSLDGGWLTEADDDSGRQRFVPTPLGGHKYLIKAYENVFTNDPATLEPSCWQVYNSDSTDPLTVEGVACDATNPDQQFTITPEGDGTYAISNDSAFLQFSESRGLILEELGDAPLLSTFWFVDNGPAPRVGG
jgi:hypothetical protein